MRLLASPLEVVIEELRVTVVHGPHQVRGTRLARTQREIAGDLLVGIHLSPVPFGWHKAAQTWQFPPAIRRDARFAM
jgi:hypothetical protein